MTAADLDRVAGPVMQVLWRSSWQAAVLAGIVLMLQFLLKRNMTARWRHALWWIVLLRLLVPVTPASSISVFNVAPARPMNVSIAEVSPQIAVPTALQITAAHAPEGTGPLSTSPVRRLASSPIRWSSILFVTWLAGLVLMLARIAWASIRLSRAVRHMQPVSDPAVLAMLDRCRADLHVGRRMEVLTAPDIGAPALMGFIRPRLLLPPTVLANFDSAELRLILLHELAHSKRHDVVINWLASILHAVHWFNPIVWISVLRLRGDRELAADELVLSLTGDDERGAYGNTLVKLLQTLSRRPALSGTVGILERAHPMRRRITMIAQFKARTGRWTVVGASSCLLVLAGLGLTDAVRGDAPPAAKPPAAVAATTQHEPVVASASSSTESAPSIPASTQPSDAELTYAKFQKRVPEVNFDKIPASDVFNFVRDVTGVDIVVNWRAFEAAGIDRSTPVELQLKNATLEQVLRRLLDQVGGGNIALGFGVDGGSIVISTMDDMSRDTRVRAYEVGDLITTATTRPGTEGQIAAVDSLRQLIISNVAPDSWADSGGTVGNISTFGTKVIVKTIDMNHLDIDRMLAELRRKH